MSNSSKLTKTAGGVLPSWLINLLGFGLLIILVLAAFFYQMHGINESLKNNVRERSLNVAAIVEENLANAALALTTIDQMVAAFLRDKAEFIAYLDGIDPLQPEELSALARETGLLGITLVRPDNRSVAGPPKWFPEPIGCEDNTDSIRYHGNTILLLQNFSTQSNDLSCVLTGLDGTAIADLRNKSSLDTLLASLSTLPGIHAVELLHEADTSTGSSVELITDNGQAIAQSRFPTGMGTLVVSLDAHRFLKHRARLRQQFFFFAALLMVLGIFFSWLLYRVQQKNLHQAMAFEQILAQEHEDAALGRTTSTIAHEIRNPLNAINMGLQRLRMESDTLDQEQKDLISAMGEAVKRTSGIVVELQRFTRPLEPADDTVHLDKQLNQLLTLYDPQIKKQQINLTVDCPEPITLQGDRDLLNELLENIIKNAVEAQPEGGKILITLFDKNKTVQLRLKNSGFLLNADESGRIGEPYFTTKTRGTGLGLALSRRIAKAHGGELEILPDCREKELTITLKLPKGKRE